MKPTQSYLLSAIFLLVTGTAWGGSVTLPNTFTAGTPAKAAEVNANFNAVKAAADDNDRRIAALEATVTALQNTVTALQTQLSTVTSSNVMALNPYLTVDTASDPRGPMVRFHSVNVQVVNGLGSTNTVNGLGNLIIGYDEVDTSGNSHCTIGTTSGDNPITDSGTCGTAGGTWTTAGFKTGSHYLVVGTQNNYSRWGGIVAGESNTSNYDYASVTGGYNNTAGGSFSSVSGGASNTAARAGSSVSGGNVNTASGYDSSISGGQYNIATADLSSISGGYSNVTSGSYSSVSGGDTNTASGTYSSVTGGQYNGASGQHSSVSGGYSSFAQADWSAVFAGYNNLITSGGTYSAILGGQSQNITTSYQTLPALP